GCNYGFGLDIARRTFGWHVVGVEPSLAGVRGARELGIDIRPEYLTPDSDLGGTFELVTAIEVIEHVPDPLAFLNTVRSVLSPGGVLVMTTPAAEVVREDAPLTDVLRVLSAGYHVFLASQAGMAALLARAGFAAVDVELDHTTLRVRAATEALPPSPGYTTFDPALLEQYYEEVGAAAPRGSALRLGMLTRGLRLAVARARWASARRTARMMQAEFRRRYAIDLTRPGRTSDQLRSGAVVPWPLIGASFALGMLELLDSGRAQRAAELFELASLAAEKWSADQNILDLDTVDLVEQAAYHRALALARTDPALVPAIVAGWPEPADVDARERLDARLCRLAVELLNQGRDAEAAALTADLAARASRASTSVSPSIALDGRDGLYAAGVLALRRGDTASARELLDRCLVRCSETSGAHAASLAQLVRDTLESIAASPVDGIGAVLL
ncbi:MAG TPA: class I SAM-dependent methyltransferase, partial [Pseudolysinimonas sp.]